MTKCPECKGELASWTLEVECSRCVVEDHPGAQSKYQLLACLKAECGWCGMGTPYSVGTIKATKQSCPGTAKPLEDDPRDYGWRSVALPGGGQETHLLPFCKCIYLARGPEGGVCGNCGGAIRRTVYGNVPRV